MMRAIRWAAGAAALAGVAALAAGTFLGGRAPAYHGTLLDPPLEPRDFTLRSADGPVRLSDLRGRYVAVFFGYTSCPDVCPTTLARLTAARREAGVAGDRLAILLVTVDPERDSPERLAEYAAAFGPGVLGLTGSPGEIARVATEFGIYYERVEAGSAAGYLVDHTATVTVLDPEGRPRLVWGPQLGAAELAADIRGLLKE